MAGPSAWKEGRIGAYLDPDRPLTESYFDLVEETYNHVNSWRFGAIREHER